MSERRDSVSAAEEPAQTLPSAVGARDASRRGGRSRPASPHSHKFLAVTATLVGFAIGALGLAVVLLLGGSRPSAGPEWSSWSPPDGGLAGEREIADAVSPFYRAAPADQLVIVTVSNIDSSSTTSQIALQDPNTGSLAELGGTTAVYNLCGLGPACAIAVGTPSAARELLLRRESLELALYTFRYISGIDNVVAILPPGHATSTTTGSLTPSPPSPSHAASSAKAATTTVDLAVLFQRQALERYVSQPLRDTLPEELPPTVSEIDEAPEAELVSVLTGQALFTQRTVQAQDGSSVLVLDPIPPQ